MTPKPPVKTFYLRRDKKRRLYLAVTISFIVMMLMFWLFSFLNFGQGKYLALLIGIAALLTFTFVLLSLIHLTKENFIGMFISGRGINDISTGHAYGMVLWKDVISIKVLTELGNVNHKYIVLKVINPQEYIDREPNHSKKRSMILKHHYYGSPICFSNRELDCTFEELQDCIFEYYNNYLQRKKEKVGALKKNDKAM
jgi:hypothetical protein